MYSPKTTELDPAQPTNASKVDRECNVSRETYMSIGWGWRKRARLTEQDDIAGEHCGRQELGSSVYELQVVLQHHNEVISNRLKKREVMGDLLFLHRSSEWPSQTPYTPSSLLQRSTFLRPR